jgi:23S rRNA (adenine2030-N6)-methyltransferase
MNYNHAYHAGNFADVFKHCVLILLVEFLCKKEKPFVYLDTHAGQGGYDLTGAMAQKSAEYETGIARLCQLDPGHTCNPGHGVAVPRTIHTYLDIIRQYNQAQRDKNRERRRTTTAVKAADMRNLPQSCQCRYYPGSPLVARSLLRPCDRMILNEVHPECIAALKQTFSNDHQVAIHHVNGYQSLKAFLPPPERRALILIDPTFETKDEWQQIIAALHDAALRFPMGVYAIWYPIKAIKERAELPGRGPGPGSGCSAIACFHKELRNIGFADILATMFTANVNVFHKPLLHEKSLIPRLTSCGMTIINPPWQFASALEQLISWLHTVL